MTSQFVRNSLCTLALFLVLMSLVGCGTSMSPSTVVEKYWTLVNEGEYEYEKALQYVASGAETQMMLAMSMSQMISGMLGLSFTDVVTCGESISGNRAIVLFYFRLSDGSTTDTDEIELVKENGRWKIGPLETELW